MLKNYLHKKTAQSIHILFLKHVKKTYVAFLKIVSLSLCELIQNFGLPHTLKQSYWLYIIKTMVTLKLLVFCLQC